MELEVDDFWTPVHLNIWVSHKLVGLWIWVHSPHWKTLFIQETQIGGEGLPSEKSTEIFQYCLICIFNSHQDLSGWLYLGPIPWYKL